MFYYTMDPRMEWVSVLLNEKTTITNHLNPKGQTPEQIRHALDEILKLNPDPNQTFDWIGDMSLLDSLMQNEHALPVLREFLNHPGLNVNQVVHDQTSLMKSLETGWNPEAALLLLNHPKIDITFRPPEAANYPRNYLYERVFLYNALKYPEYAIKILEGFIKNGLVFDETARDAFIQSVPDGQQRIEQWEARSKGRNLAALKALSREAKEPTQENRSREAAINPEEGPGAIIASMLTGLPGSVEQQWTELKKAAGAASGGYRKRTRRAKRTKRSRRRQQKRKSA